MTNREWIAKGNTGCTFATLFAKDPDKVGWYFVNFTYWQEMYYDELFTKVNIVSLEFPEYADWKGVKRWALAHSFFVEETSPETEGLRILCGAHVSWVQYFGPDSHVPTRRTPIPMLMFTCKLGTSFYAKVGFHGILHLAHAFYDKINEKVYDLLWDRSYKQVKKKIGHTPTIKEAAKTTFLIEKDK